ncbi:MAG: HD domain-containing protein [Chloroflexi bacterium]|nr:HD domain-containing protein [Chloroflexota bacterium]
MERDISQVIAEDEEKVAHGERIFFSVPARHNTKLQHLITLINEDEELYQLWRCANVNAVDRNHMSDHGPVHIKIVANLALKLLRLLMEADVPLGVVQHHDLTPDDAEVVVVLAAALHDLGIAIHRENHEEYSLILAKDKARELLAPIYPVRERTILMAEVLHAIIAHHWDVRCYTTEASVVKVADALDMTHGRSRIAFESGDINIHSVSAQAIDAVYVRKGNGIPVEIEIVMANSAGIFQVDNLLKRKLHNSTIAHYVRVVAKVAQDTERKIVETYVL